MSTEKKIQSIKEIRDANNRIVSKLKNFMNTVTSPKGLLFILATLATTLGITYAVFADRGQVLGSTFNVGSADLKLLGDIGLGTAQTNLFDDLQGPTFENIGPNWQQDYKVGIYNNGTSDLELITTANYETANDPENLRQVIYVEPIEWQDINNNGEVDEGELGSSLGKKTIVKWKTEGFELGTIGTGETRTFVLRFSTENISDTKQGASAIFDFVFDAQEIQQ